MSGREEGERKAKGSRVLSIVRRCREEKENIHHYQTNGNHHWEDLSRELCEEMEDKT